VIAARRIDAQVYVEHPHASVYLLQPITPQAKEWTTEHLPEDAPMLGASFAIEARYLGPIIEGMEAEGLHVVAVPEARPRKRRRS